MNIYSFIPSKDIEEYCRKINHQFTSLETAVIVYWSDAPIDDRHQAWKWIIDTQEDTSLESLHERLSKKKLYDFLKQQHVSLNSLHSFLEQYISFEKKYIDLFIRDEENEIHKRNKILG